MYNSYVLEGKQYLDVPFEVKAMDVDEKGTFEGYAAIFGGAPDDKGDVIRPGAFLDSLRKGGRNEDGIAMLFYHQPTEVIGVWLWAAEDAKGLFVKGKLALGTQRGRETYELMKMGAITGMSIGYDTQQASWNKKKSIRYIEKALLWEISIVTFGAHKKAKVLEVKSEEQDTEQQEDDASSIIKANTERELENALRESSLSKSEALYVAKLCRNSLRESGEEDNNNEKQESVDSFDELLDSLRSTNTRLAMSRKLEGF